MNTSKVPGDANSHAEADLHAEPAASHGGILSEDEIDAQLDDSFPASDPPSWTLGVESRETASTLRGE